MTIKSLLLRFSVVIVTIVISLCTNAQSHLYSQTARGGIGLLQTPTARMSEEGELYLNYNDVDQYRFWSTSLQLFPWMESTVRYTDVRTQLYSPFPGFSGNQTLKDKGIDAKFRIWEESFYLPDIAVGFLDIGGTGLFRSEYIAMSKAAGPFDFHLGMGWGYLGTHNDITNPLCELKDSFCERPDGFSGSGGKIDYDQFFKGPAALFGGVEYQTPIEGLRLKLEYDGNDYVNDRAGLLEQKTRWNLGAVYQWDNFDFSLSYQRGNTLSFGVSYHFNLHTLRQMKFDRAPRPLLNTKPATDMNSLNRQRLYQDLNDEGRFLLSATHQEDNEMTFYGVQYAYRDYAEATERVGRILASELPESIETYKIVELNIQTPMLETEIDAKAFKAAANYESLEADITSTYLHRDPSKYSVDNFEKRDVSGLLFSTETFWIQTFGNPEDFYLYQGGITLNSGYMFNSNYSFRIGGKATILENFDKFNFTTDNFTSTLPRVRTDIREYVTRSNVTMENAYLHWFDRIGPDLYGQAYVGYLESMFGGIGAEAMYRPVGSNLSFGIDLNYVRQRSYENDVDFFDYKTFTGHASAYWNPSFMPSAQLSLSVGQFLAGDKGVNIDLAKRFDSGIVVGAFAAFTNVSAAEYGEGSFTKGFYISLPLDLLTFTPAKGRGKLPWIPIARDGGQMLQRPMTLKSMTDMRAPFYD